MYLHVHNVQCGKWSKYLAHEYSGIKRTAGVENASITNDWWYDVGRMGGRIKLKVSICTNLQCMGGNNWLN